MEINVWMRLFAQVASYLSSLFASSSNPKNPNNGGASQKAPVNDAASISTSTSVTRQVLRVVRNPTLATKDAHFGDMAYNGQWICFTMERKSVAIPTGIYLTHKELSPHFGFATPHLSVPDRTYIEIHPANYPSQLEGCIAVGTEIDHDNLDNSRLAFDKMMAIVPDSFIVEVVSSNNQPKA